MARRDDDRARRMFAEETDTDVSTDIEITNVVRKDLEGPEDISRYIDGILFHFACDKSTKAVADVVENASGDSGNELRGHKIAWSDDEDAGAAYEALKNRKSLKRKRVADQTRKARAVIAAGSKGNSKSMVGRRIRKKVEDAADEANAKRLTAHGESTDEDELLDEALPDYIKERKEKFEKARDSLGEAGLRLPPDYDGIEFSDDERLDSLKEKPQLPIDPIKSYEDIALPTSGGIIPAPIAQWLREYQVTGAEFLHGLFVYQMGGILGDDMVSRTVWDLNFVALILRPGTWENDPGHCVPDRSIWEDWR